VDVHLLDFYPTQPFLLSGYAYYSRRTGGILMFEGIVGRWL